MNMNSLVIAIDSERARIFRTGHPSASATPVELLEIDVLAFDESGVDRERRFAHRIATRAAAFAHDHFCNPVILTANRAMMSLLLPELERELPRAYIRPVTTDESNLSRGELMRSLEREDAFSPRHYPMQA